MMRAFVSGQVVGLNSFPSKKNPGQTVQVVSIYDGKKSVIEVFDYPGDMPEKGSYLDYVPVSITLTRSGNLFVFAMKQ